MNNAVVLEAQIYLRLKDETMKTWQKANCVSSKTRKCRIRIDALMQQKKQQNH